MVGSLPLGRPPWSCRGFPTDFLMVGCPVSVGLVQMRRGFPTDFLMVGLVVQPRAAAKGRGFPTDFLMVG